MSVYRLGERIDSANAAKFEEDISGFIEREAPEELILDAEEQFVIDRCVSDITEQWRSL